MKKGTIFGIGSIGAFVVTNVIVSLVLNHFERKRLEEENEAYKMAMEETDKIIANMVSEMNRDIIKKHEEA